MTIKIIIFTRKYKDLTIILIFLSYVMKIAEKGKVLSGGLDKDNCGKSR